MAEIPLAERVDALEAEVAGLQQLPVQIARLEGVLREEIRTGDDETRRSLRQEIRGGDEETRRQMRVLHEDLVGRIKTIGEAIDRAPSRRKPSR